MAISDAGTGGEYNLCKQQPVTLIHYQYSQVFHDKSYSQLYVSCIPTYTRG